MSKPGKEYGKDYSKKNEWMKNMMRVNGSSRFKIRQSRRGLLITIQENRKEFALRDRNTGIVIWLPMIR